MKVAIDKKCISKIKDFTEFDYIYVFEDEPLNELLKTNLHCIHKDYIDEVEINLTNYNIECIKKASIDDKDCFDIPLKKDYKFAIIVPNCNNDHRKI